MRPVASISPTSADRSLRWLATGNDGAWPIHASAAGQEPLSFARAYSISLRGPDFACQRPARHRAGRIDRHSLRRIRPPNPHSTR